MQMGVVLFTVVLLAITRAGFMAIVHRLVAPFFWLFFFSLSFSFSFAFFPFFSFRFCIIIFLLFWIFFFFSFCWFFDPCVFLSFSFQLYKLSPSFFLKFFVFLLLIYATRISPPPSLFPHCLFSSPRLILYLLLFMLRSLFDHPSFSFLPPLPLPPFFHSTSSFSSFSYSSQKADKINNTGKTVTEP